MPLYASYSDYFKRLFGQRVQKLSVDAGFTCPNRDGSLGVGGCSFCNNDAFSPSYCRPADSQMPLHVPAVRRLEKSISHQLDEGIEFHAWRYRKSSLYLAYFQAYSNTYAPVDVLRERYLEALSHPQVVGLVVGTRPDCVDEEKLDLLADFAKEHFIAVEYGIESCCDQTLRAIRRGHDFDTSRKAVIATAQRGIHCGAHIILGLPGESRDMLLEEASVLSSLPLNTVKFHQLQILRGSLMEQDYRQWSATHPSPSVAIGDGYHAFSLEEYIDLVCDILERLRPDLVVERFAGEVPPRFQAAPERSWRRPDGRLLRNEEIPALVEAELSRRGSRQGARQAAQPLP